MPPTIPFEILLKIMGYIENPTMGEYIRLAQVNHDFRAFFLSDAAWAKFDVHGVRDEVHIYRHGGYELRGIAAHFYNHLISCDPPMRAWGFNRMRRPDGPMLIASVTAPDRYSQLNVLTLFGEIYDPYSDLVEAFLERVPLIALDVWKLWVTHPREPRDEPITGFEDVLPAPVARDKQLVLALLQQNLISPYSDVVDAFDDDRDISMVLAAHYFSHKEERRLPSDQFLQDEEFVLEALDFAAASNFCDDEDLLAFLSHQWHHKAIVLKVLSMDGDLLEHASEELRADREIVLAAAKRSPWTLDDAPETLRNDREFILEAFEVQLPAAQGRTERDIVLQAVKVDGINLKWAPDEFQGDREIVLAAVRKTARALEYAAEPLRGDRDIVLKASQSFCSNCHFALLYASEALQNDRQVVLKAVERDGRALRYASAEMQEDREVVLAAIKQSLWAFEYVSVALRGDIQWVSDALVALKGLNGYLNLADRSRVFWRFVSDDLRSNETFVRRMVEWGCLSLDCAPRAVRNDRKLVLVAVKNDASEFKYAPDTLRGDRDFVLCVVRQSPAALRYASEDLQYDPEIEAAAWGKRTRRSTRV